MMEKMLTKPLILIIDDETEWSESIELFYKRKYDFKIVENSIEGMNELKDKNYDIVMVDFRLLEEKDGIQVIHDIRTFNKFIPVIFVSGKIANKNPIINAIEEGISFYVDKNDEKITEKIGIAILKALESRDIIIKILEKWLYDFGDKDKIIVESIIGDKYSINDILNELKKDSPVGKDIYEGIIKIVLRLLNQEEK